MSVVNVGAPHPAGSSFVTVTGVEGSVSQLPGLHSAGTYNANQYMDPRYQVPARQFTSADQLIGQTFEVLSSVGSPGNMVYELKGHLELYGMFGKYYLSTPGLYGYQVVTIA